MKMRTSPTGSRLSGLCCSILLLVLSTGRCAAQQYSVQLEHWDRNNGLPHRQVNAIQFDKTGFMWLATPGGLCRFDGYRFVRYSQAQYGLPFANLGGMAQGNGGVIWLVGHSGINNLSLFNPTTGLVRRPRADPNHHYNYLDKLPDGRLIFASYDAPAMLWLTDERDSLRVIPARSPVGAAFRYLTAYGTIWLSYGYRDMYEITLGGSLLAHWTLPDSMAFNSNMTMGGTGTAIARGTTGKVYTISDQKEVRSLPYVSAPAAANTDLVVDCGIDGIICRQGRLYHPIMGKLRDLPAEGWDDLEGGVRFAVVRAPGDVWIGGSFGLYHLTIRRNNFIRLFYDTARRQLPDNGYRGILVSGNRVLAAQEVEGILSQQRDGLNRSVVYPGQPPSARFTVLMRLADSSVLAASHFWLYRADKEANRFSVLGSTGDVPVWCAFEWSGSRLLLGTEQGLAWFDRQKNQLVPFTGYGSFAALRETVVNDIVRLHNGLCCVCTDNGLYLLNGAGILVARYADDQSGAGFLPATRFLSCTPDGSGQCFLATGSGLIRWSRDKRTYRQYNTLNGLSNETIYAVCPDDYGRLWLPTDYGLVALDTASGHVENYFLEDGITSNEFNRASRYRDADGRIYLGTINGVTAFQPKDFKPYQAGVGDTLRAPLVITSFRQYDGSEHLYEDRTSELLRTRTIFMKPGDRLLSIELALLNFRDPARTVYYWKMDGEEDAGGWNEQQERSLRIGRPPYGRHILRIRARSTDGYASKEEIRITVVVEKPWFLRTGVIAAGLAVVTGIIAVVYAARGYKLRRQNRALDALVQNKTTDLRAALEQKEVLLKEIHHRVRNNLQVISSLLRLQSQGIGEELAKAALVEGQNRVLSIALVHQLLYEEKEMDAVGLRSLANGLFAQLQSLYTTHRVQLTNDIPDYRLSIHLAVPLGLILNELFTNSFKHAFAGVDAPAIRLVLEKRGGEYVFTYADNGPGVQEAAGEGSDTLGISLVRILTKQLRGSMAYHQSGAGIFTLRFPG